MPQSLIRLPKTAEFEIAGFSITIVDHNVAHNNALLSRIMQIVNDSISNRNTLYQFEKYGVSFEMVIEYCVWEIENDIDVLADLIWFRDAISKFIHTTRGVIQWSECKDFSKSVAGRWISEQYTEKIRSCNNWEELYNMMRWNCKFQMDMEERIIKEIKEQKMEEMKQ